MGCGGCRGRRVAVAKLSDGQVMIAKRERKGIEVSVLDGPIGGAPALVLATVSESESATVSAKENWRGPRVLFGDIQQHSAHSDGIGSADECYLRSRYRYGDDFAALTDHESFLGKRIGPGEWAYLQAVTEHHNAPGEFATIVAYEWTGKMFPGPGHKVIYLDGPGHDIVSRDDVPSGQGIVDKVIEMGAFTGPHHIGWTGADADSHDPKAQPIWEICSCHGCYEHADSPLGARGELRNQFAQPMLNQGHRFGFIACSDSHGLLWHHGECRKRDPFRTGLTGVLAEEKTREALLDAIRNRRGVTPPVAPKSCSTLWRATRARCPWALKLKSWVNFRLSHAPREPPRSAAWSLLAPTGSSPKPTGKVCQQSCLRQCTRPTCMHGSSRKMAKWPGPARFSWIGRAILSEILYRGLGPYPMGCEQFSKIDGGRDRLHGDGLGSHADAQAYEGVTPGTDNPPPRAQRLNKRDRVVTWPGFQVLSNGSSRFFVQSTRPVSFDVRKSNKRFRSADQAQQDPFGQQPSPARNPTF